MFERLFKQDLQSQSRSKYLERAFRDPVSLHSRLANVLREGMHQPLMNILDDSIVHAVHMDRHISQFCGLTTVEPREGDRMDFVIVSPLKCPNRCV